MRINGTGNITYLEELVKNLSEVPKDIYGVFALIGELDVKCKATAEDMTKLSKQYLSKSKRTLKDLQSEETQEMMGKIEQQHKDCVKLSKEKLDLANRAYDVVDNHIRRLDEYLSRFEYELRETGQDMNAKSDGTKELEAKELDMPIDPNEPTYCVCHRVSFGEMVACDNPECKIEWFHFECVDLKKQPKGRWYCPECTENLKKKRKL